MQNEKFLTGRIVSYTFAFFIVNFALPLVEG